SNGAKGIVVETDPQNPRHPIIKLLINQQGVAFPEQPILHLKEGDSIQVVRPLVKKELQQLKALQALL
ncbi:MAG: hypothetical protein AB1798_01645, partial [Spirochaetota bacterium]